MVGKERKKREKRNNGRKKVRKVIQGGRGEKVRENE
jgi:hypothetical protein